MFGWILAQGLCINIHTYLVHKSLYICTQFSRACSALDHAFLPTAFWNKARSSSSLIPDWRHCFKLNFNLRPNKLQLPLNLLWCPHCINHPSASLCKEIKSFPPSQKGWLPTVNQKLFYLFIALGTSWICQPTWQPGGHWSFFCNQEPPGTGAVHSPCQGTRDSSSVLGNGTWDTQDGQSWAHSDSWAPHLWALLGSADPLARDTGPQNQLLPKFSVKWVCDCCGTYRQHREHGVLQSLTSEVITMRWGRVLGWGQTLSAQSSPPPCGIDSTNKDCKLVCHCRKWTKAEKMSCRLNNPAGSFGSCKGVSNELFSRHPIVREKT